MAKAPSCTDTRISIGIPAKLHLLKKTAFSVHRVGESNATVMSQRRNHPNAFGNGMSSSLHVAMHHNNCSHEGLFELNTNKMTHTMHSTNLKNRNRAPESQEANSTLARRRAMNEASTCQALLASAGDDVTRLKFEEPSQVLCAQASHERQENDSLTLSAFYRECAGAFQTSLGFDR